MSDPTAEVLRTANNTSPPAADTWYGEIDGVRLVDRLTSYYNILLAFVWLILVPQWSTAVWLFLAHAMAATIPLQLKRAKGRLSRFGRVLRDIYPLIFILPFWTELDIVRRLLHDANFDRVVGALDLALFGIHLDTVFLPNMDAIWFSEIMYFAYFAYYLTVVVPLLYMAFKGSPEMKSDITFRVVLIYVSCFFVYIAFPVDGPHWLTEHYQGDFQRGFFYQLEQALQSEGDALETDCLASHLRGIRSRVVHGLYAEPLRHRFGGWGHLGFLDSADGRSGVAALVAIRAAPGYGNLGFSSRPRPPLKQFER
jgi:hypothetical protein